MNVRNFTDAVCDISKVNLGEPEMTKSEERKIRKALNTNRNMFRQNEDMFSEIEPRFHTCPSYNPCPICKKCKNKASHLFVKCQICKIPICSHTYDNMKRMIRRENRQILADNHLSNLIKNIVEEQGSIRNE